MPSRYTGQRTSGSGGSANITVSDIRTALATASDMDKFAIMSDLYATEELYAESTPSLKSNNVWHVINFSRAITRAENNKFLYIRFYNNRRQAEAKVRVGRFISLPTMSPADNLFDEQALAVPFFSGDYRNGRTFSQGDIVTLYISRPTQTSPDVNKIMLGTSGFGGEPRTNNVWRNFQAVIELRSF